MQDAPAHNPPMVVQAATARMLERATAGPTADFYHCAYCRRAYLKAVFFAHMRACVLAHPAEIVRVLGAQVARGREDLARKADPAGLWRP